MKKAVFFIVLLLIGYMAGMYGNAALMVLFLSQLMIAAVMFCLSRYMAARLEISFSEKTIFAEKEVPFPIHIRAVNRGRLPVARFILMIEESRARWKRKVKNRIPGECGEGENLLAAETLVSDCGIVTFHITEIRVYDYLSLFFGRKRADLVCQAVVFPKDRALSIELGNYPGGNDEDMTMPFSEHGNSHDEVRQIREYRAGDPVCHIHWNQTAKNGNLWVKEYEDERKPVITLYLVFTVLFIGAPLAGIHPGMESAVLLLAVIPLSVLGAALFGDELSSAVYEGEGFVSRSLQRISGNADETAASGHVSRGNNYRTGDPQMEVVLTREPTETLYLKGFSGGVYSDGEWEPADDEEIFLSVAVSLHWDAWRSWVASMFQNMYFVMNGLSVVQEISEPGVIYIIPYNGRSDITYIPYYSGWMNSWWGEQPGYGFQYFEQHEMNVRWNHVWQGYERMSQWYRQIREEYEKEIQTAYTMVPKDALPGLTALCEDNPRSGTDEVTAFIVSFLENQASYTLTPGRAPVNQDIVEYFLFENREGYCVHFSSAATLMYRLYGISARYVSGYAIRPSDFIEQEDGTWTAEVTDESAHAWTEIFLSDYGWTPVEVTPSPDGTIHASYPGLDGTMLRDMISSAGWSGSSEAENTAGENEDQEEDGSSGSGADGMLSLEFSVDQETGRRLLWGAVLTLLILAAGVPVLLSLRRKAMKRKLESQTCRNIFAGYLDDELSGSRKMKFRYIRAFY